VAEFNKEVAVRRAVMNYMPIPSHQQQFLLCPGKLCFSVTPRTNQCNSPGKLILPKTSWQPYLIGLLDSALQGE
jgi:hypothetical protein